MRGRQPNRETRWLSHALVGVLVGCMTAQVKGLGFIGGAVLAAGAHEALDAPMADVLNDFGI